MSLFLIISLLIISVIGILITKKRSIIESLSLLVSGITCIVSFLIAYKVSSVGTVTFFTFFSLDALGAIVLMIIGSIGFATTIYSIAYLREETKKHIIGFTRVKQYFILLQLFLFAMYLAITAGSPIFAWIAIEATTLSTAFLISFYDKPSAIEGAWKYLIINSVGLLLGFFGTLLYFTSVSSLGEGGFVSWQTLRENASHLDPLIAKIAFVFVLIGYGTKVGFAPMHTWKPDAYSKAPAPLGALLSGALLPVAFFILLKFKTITDLSIGYSFSQTLFFIFGLFSIAVASLIMFNARNYKRLLAYSSIENAGIIALGFGFGGLGVFGAVLHLLYHSAVKVIMFFSAGNILLKYHSAKIQNIKNAFHIIPTTSILFVLGFLIVTGTPPFGIFFSKIYILGTGIKTHPVVALIAILFMTMVFVGFLRHITQMFLSRSTEEKESGEGNIWLVIPPLFFLFLIVLLSFYIPPFLTKLIHTVTLYYTYD